MDHVPDLAGCRILVVEDEYLLAIGIADEIEDHGGIVVGPMTTLDDGMRALEEHKPDAAIVNINLGPDKVYPLADQMRAKDVPFVFASSEDRAAIPDRFNDVPLHSKRAAAFEADQHGQCGRCTDADVTRRKLDDVRFEQARRPRRAC